MVDQKPLQRNHGITIKDVSARPPLSQMHQHTGSQETRFAKQKGEHARHNSNAIPSGCNDTAGTTGLHIALLRRAHSGLKFELN